MSMSHEQFCGCGSSNAPLPPRVVLDTDASADENVEVHGLYGEYGHCTGCVGITTNWIVPATADDRLCDECRGFIAATP
jgi:hypothetical protein